MSIALLGALAACRAEAAETESAGAPMIAIPKTWSAAPELASAMQGVAGMKVERADAWAERAMGCYAASLAVGAGGAPEDVARQITGALGSGAAVEVEMPNADSGVLAFKLERSGYHGRVRAAIDPARVELLACFWNDREPAACEAACAGILGSVK